MLTWWNLAVYHRARSEETGSWMNKSQKIVLTGAALLFVVLSMATLGACSQQVPGEVQQVEVTRIVEVPLEVEVTREVQVEVPVEVIVEITPEPTAIPQNFVFLELTGAGGGGFVTDNFTWPACQKAVFTAEKSEHDNFAAYAINVDTGDDWLMFNLLDEDRTEELQPLIGGTYYIELEYVPAGPWTIKGECRD